MTDIKKNEHTETSEPEKVQWAADMAITRWISEEESVQETPKLESGTLVLERTSISENEELPESIDVEVTQCKGDEVCDIKAEYPKSALSTADRMKITLVFHTVEIGDYVGLRVRSSTSASNDHYPIRLTLSSEYLWEYYPSGCEPSFFEKWSYLTCDNCRGDTMCAMARAIGRVNLNVLLSLALLALSTILGQVLTYYHQDDPSRVSRSNSNGGDTLPAMDDFKSQLIPLIKKFEEETNEKIIQIRVRYFGASPESPIVSTES